MKDQGYLNETVVEEEPESGRGCHKSLLKLLLDCSMNNWFNIRAWFSVVLYMKLSKSAFAEEEEKKE